MSRRIHRRKSCVIAVDLPFIELSRLALIHMGKCFSIAINQLFKANSC